jgi:hypothetical protein
MGRKAIPTGHRWIAQIFSAASVRNGGVVRRSVEDVKKFASPTSLKAEVLARGYHLIRTGDQYVILCHPGDIRVIC